MNNYSSAVVPLVKGMRTPDKEVIYKNALQSALEIGYKILKKGESAVNFFGFQ